MAIQASEIAVIFDTSFGADMESRSLNGSENELPIFEDMIKIPGRYLLLSGKTGEGAMEIDDHRHGVFTFYFIEGIKGPADFNKDNRITLGELHEFLSGKVIEETQMEGSVQHPQLIGSGADKMIIEGSR